VNNSPVGTSEENPVKLQDAAICGRLWQKLREARIKAGPTQAKGAERTGLNSRDGSCGAYLGAGGSNRKN
jgi:hypothetical protein